MTHYRTITAHDLATLSRDDLNIRLAIAYQRGRRAAALYRRRPALRSLRRVARLESDALSDFLDLNRGVWRHVIVSAPGGHTGRDETEQLIRLHVASVLWTWSPNGGASPTTWVRRHLLGSVIGARTRQSTYARRRIGGVAVDIGGLPSNDVGAIIDLADGRWSPEDAVIANLDSERAMSRFVTHVVEILDDEEVGVLSDRIDRVPDLTADRDRRHQARLRIAAKTAHPAVGFIDNEDWREAAACRGADISLFLPARGHNPTATIARYCERCAVRADCLASALERGLPGVWGGQTANQRELSRRSPPKRESPAATQIDT